MRRANEILAVYTMERGKEHSYVIGLISDIGEGMERWKVLQLWERAKEHESLFSDYTQGQFEPFLAVTQDPRSIWFEIVEITDGQYETVGAIYATRVIPRFDCTGHIAFWDRKAGGRQPIIWAVAEYMFKRFDLHRISGEIAGHHRGALRFLREAGFVEEGERREAIPYKGQWKGLILLGLLREELEAAKEGYYERRAIRG